MALNTANISHFFKVLGKLIYIKGLAEAQATQYDLVMMALVDQGIDADASKIDLYELVIVPFNTKMKSNAKGIEQIAATVVTFANTYLTKVVATQAGLTQPTVAKVLDEMRAKMFANGQYITDSGVFDAFFTNVLNYNNLPTAGTVLIPDTYVGEGVV